MNELLPINGNPLIKTLERDEKRRSKFCDIICVTEFGNETDGRYKKEKTGNMIHEDEYADRDPQISFHRSEAE